MNAIGTQLRDPINLALMQWWLTVYVVAVVEIGRNPVSKHYIQAKCGECAGWRKMRRPNLSRQTKFSGANGEREKCIFLSSAKNEQDWQPYPVDPYYAESADHAYPDRTPCRAARMLACHIME